MKDVYGTGCERNQCDESYFRNRKVKFDPNKIVDIEAYDQKKKYTGRNESGLAYRLKDLLKWNDTMNSTKDTNAENPDYCLLERKMVLIIIIVILNLQRLLMQRN